MTDGPSSPVVARYRARPVAADGYLDLATVQIYATASGRPVSPGSLHLPYLKLGNVAALQLDQNVTVLGFPGVADSDSITVTSGVLSTFVPDPQSTSPTPGSNWRPPHGSRTATPAARRSPTRASSSACRA
jgi:putative serine protease PepD